MSHQLVIVMTSRRQEVRRRVILGAAWLASCGAVAALSAWIAS